MKEKIEQTISILFILSLPFIIYLLSTSKSSEIIRNGKVIDFTATSSEDGVESFLIVKLDNNKTVYIPYHGAAGLQIGKKIILKEKTTNFFDIKRYNILKLGDKI